MLLFNTELNTELSNIPTSHWETALGLLLDTIVAFMVVSCPIGSPRRLTLQLGTANDNDLMMNSIAEQGGLYIMPKWAFLT